MTSLHGKLHDERRSYEKDTLHKADTHDSPFIQFDYWYKEAASLKAFEANAMTLSTIDKDNAPHSRIVLLKEYTPKGFTFFTNYESAKGKHIATNQKVSLLFFYEAMERQIRIEGIARKISNKENDAYFYSRPIESQYSAMASPQSMILDNKTKLDKKLIACKQEYEKPIRPKNWGGYEVIPHYFEFWQGRPNRLHDRIVYTLKDNAWIKDRLAP